jgi:S1-C subfamily serine protease
MFKMPRLTGRSWLQAGVLGIVIVIAMVAGGFLAVAVAGNDDSPAAVATQPAGAAASDTASASPTDSNSNVSLTAIDDLPSLVDKVMPSVVAISTVSGSGIRQAEGLGTGVVIDKDGNILTNNHVIDGANQVSVEFTDGTVVPGTVVGTDPGNDLAVVHVDVDGSKLHPAALGDSDKAKPGQPVFAIGNPFSQKFTVTAGIISAVDSDSPGDSSSGRPVRGMLQTDAAVNPGNSGGPLFNDAGEVIGINESIENPTGQRVWVGVGFAVASNTAQRFLPDMLAGKPITHPQLGVSGVTLNDLNAKSAGVNVTKGVYITTVASGSAADKAGLRAPSASAVNNAAPGELPPGGDVVTKIDGKDVSTIEELAKLVDGYNVGDHVKLTIDRDGSEQELDVTLQEWTG